MPTGLSGNETNYTMWWKLSMLENIVDLPQAVQLEIMKKLSPGSVFRLSETSHFWNQMIDQHMKYIVDSIEVQRLTFDATQSPQILLVNTDSHMHVLDLNSPKLCRLVSERIVIKNYRNDHVEKIPRLAESLRQKQIRAKTLSFENSVISPEISSALRPENVHCDRRSIDSKNILATSAISTVNSIVSDTRLIFPMNALPFISCKRLTSKTWEGLPLKPLNQALREWQSGKRDIEFWQFEAIITEIFGRVQRFAHISDDTRRDRDIEHDQLFNGITSQCLWSRHNHAGSIVADRSLGHTKWFVTGVHSVTRSGSSRAEPGSSRCCRLRVVTMEFAVIISDWLEDPAADRETVWECVRNSSR